MPARFRRLRVLIVGCGDVGSRVARLLQGRPAPSGVAAGRVTVRALTSGGSPERLQTLRALGVTPLVGDLDDPRRRGPLQRLGALATWGLHLAPPPGRGDTDPRTEALARVWLAAQGRRQRRARALGLAAGQGGQPPSRLARRLRRLRWRHQDTRLRALVYGSTTGVYGDCAGAWLDETRAVNPESARARRRVAAERSLRTLARRSTWSTRVSCLRIPGIYAPDREGGTPRGRLLRGTPCLLPEDDVYTNHIHADDLARAALRALALGRPQRVVQVCDDSVFKAGDYFDAAADLFGLPRPPRLSAQVLQAQVSPVQWSFLRESRRLRNTRMKHELRLVLRHPQVLQGLIAL
ncbi:hypothetical protein CCO03_11015 [Comamonas serinivorans]|uniref:NAD-dependent epimerase/dehydratase domain-containing protein n=1 Tax=Comamonas serinivorans TaxID=1082851 RepID=A0A1Y0EPE9_9BURK|nr:hypothetical protein CCO03_11015 [Comamonas serinivorans]